MNYEAKTIKPFERQAKRPIKKFTSLKSEIQALISVLEQNPEQGASIGNHCYKVRLSIASKGKGKSGVARVITHIVVVENEIYLLAIYEKSELQALTQQEITNLLKFISKDG